MSRRLPPPSAVLYPFFVLAPGLGSSILDEAFDDAAVTWQMSDRSADALEDLFGRFCDQPAVLHTDDQLVSGLQAELAPQPGGDDQPPLSAEGDTFSIIFHNGSIVPRFATCVTI